MRLSELKNIGPVSEGWLEEVGIATPEELERVGPVEAYRRVRERHPREASVLLLYALQGALWDAHWNEIGPDVKARLKAAAGAS